jgi:hypothetical protein
VAEPRNRLGITLAVIGIAAVVATGAWFYFLVVSAAPAGAEGVTAATWGVRGDAMAPFAALLSTMAVIVALWTVHLQQKEIHDTREELREQVKAAERAAMAQEILAKSQQETTAAQLVANREAVRMRLAQHRANIAAMNASLATLDAAMVNLDPNSSEEAWGFIKDRRQAIGNEIHMELRLQEDVIRQLSALLTELPK